MSAKQEWIDVAVDALTKAYVPYSKFPVGAALITESGEVFQGCNIENASFGATNCGERSAIFAAYSNGYRKEDIEAIAIVTDGHRIGAPCGICRQVLSELLMDQTPIYLSNGVDTVEKTIDDLLPMRFTQEDVL